MKASTGFAMIVAAIVPLLAQADCTLANTAKIEWNGCDFSKQDFSGKVIAGEVMDNVNFSGANLQNSQLKFGTIGRSNFSGANLRGATILFQEMEEVQFDGADLAGATIKGYRYKFTTFDNANMQGSQILVSRGGDVSYENADLKGAKFYLSICGSGSVGKCNAITKFNFNYSENSRWPQQPLAKFVACKDRNVEPSEFRVLDPVDLDGDGICDSRVQALGNHGSYPNQYFFLNYEIPHGDEVLQVNYVQPKNEKNVQIEMLNSDGRRVLYRLIQGKYQQVRVDYFKPDFKSNTFVFERTGDLK